MAEDGKIIYQVEVKSDQAVAQAKEGGERAGKAISDAGKQHGGFFKEAMIGAARAVGEAFVDMASKAVSGVKQIAQAGIDFNAKMETYQTAFKTLIGDEEAAAAAIAQIREDAAKTPFDVDSLTAANQALLATGMEAGNAREDVMNLANAIAATGGGSAELSRMAANMQQIRNTGKATAMDIRQFANAGINIYGLLADSLGVTTEKAAEMDVTYEQLAAALAHAAEEGGMYEGALEAQSETFTGRISTLKDNATQLAGVLTEDLFSSLSVDALPMVMDWVATLLEAAETGGLEGAIAAAKEILTGLIESFIEGLPEMVNTGMELLVGFIQGIADNMGQVSSTAMTIITTILQGILDHAPELIVAGVTLILNLIAGLLQSLPEIITTAAELIKALWDTFFETDWSSVGKAIVDGIWAGISGAWDWLIGQVRSALSWLWNEAKSELGIASPSKKFKYIGEMSVEGMETGFAEGEDELERTVRGVYTGMLDFASANIPMASAAGVAQAVPFNMPAPVDNASGISQAVSDGLQGIGQMGSGVKTAILNVNGREFARAIFEDQQIVTNDHGVSLIVT